VEVYGFVGWIATFAAWLCYLLWSYLPEATLHEVGVSYYPNKYWALAAPAMLLCSVMSYGILYGILGLSLNPHLDSYETLGDGYSKPLFHHNQHHGAHKGSASSTPAAGVASNAGRAGPGAVAPGSGGKIRSRAGTGTAAEGPSSSSSSSSARSRGGSATDAAVAACCPDCGMPHADGHALTPAPTPAIGSPLRGPGVRASAGVAPSAPLSLSHAHTHGVGAASLITSFGPSGVRSRGSSGAGIALSAVASRGGSVASRSGGAMSPFPPSPHGTAPHPLLPPLSLDAFPRLDKTMPTPDIADVPVTLVNRLQFGYYKRKRGRAAVAATTRP
jgi:hypothetical protein